MLRIDSVDYCLMKFPFPQAAVQLVHVIAMQHCTEESCGQPAVFHVSRSPELLFPTYVLDGNCLCS